MKKLLIFICCMTFCFNLIGCTSISKPQTNLEFWIAENVDDVDFSNYQMKYGMFGGNMYYGTGYVPTLDENEQQVDPEHTIFHLIV